MSNASDCVRTDALKAHVPNKDGVIANELSRVLVLR